LVTRVYISLSSVGLCLDLINTIALQRECIASRIIKGADGASLGDRSSVASETGHHQSDRIVLADGAARQRKTPARRNQPLLWPLTGLLEALREIKKVGC